MTILQIVALESVLTLHQKIGRNRMCGIDARTALLNLGLIKPRQRLTPAMVEGYLAQCRGFIEEFEKENPPAPQEEEAPLAQNIRL